MKTFRCDEDEGTHDNTATIRETGQSDDARVTVACKPRASDGCTLTQGYWKTRVRPAPYDATWALIGEDTTFFLSGKTWYQAINTSSAGGNAYYILAHQYIAASSFARRGGSTPAVTRRLASATAFFNTYTPTSVLSNSVRARRQSWATTLDSLYRPHQAGHCSGSRRDRGRQGPARPLASAGHPRPPRSGSGDRQRRAQRDAAVEVDHVRDQHADTAVRGGSADGRLVGVPWMPAPSWKPSQRALMGLSGSFPAMTFPARSPAQALSGTYHAGLAAMLSISSPAGVANPAAPMPMRYVWRASR